MESPDRKLEEEIEGVTEAEAGRPVRASATGGMSDDSDLRASQLVQARQRANEKAGAARCDSRFSFDSDKAR